MGNFEFKVGDLVAFKTQRKNGFGRISSITHWGKKNSPPIYHVLLLSYDMLIGTSREYLEKVEGEDKDLVNALDSIGQI
jgi:hypothetical protein